MIKRQRASRKKGVFFFVWDFLALIDPNCKAHVAGGCTYFGLQNMFGKNWCWSFLDFWNLTWFTVCLTKVLDVARDWFLDLWISEYLKSSRDFISTSGPLQPTQLGTTEPISRWSTEPQGVCQSLQVIETTHHQKATFTSNHKESPSATIDLFPFQSPDIWLGKQPSMISPNRFFEMTSPPSNNRATTAMEEECRPSIGKLWRVEKLRHSWGSCWLLREIIGFSWISAILSRQENK